MQQAVVDTLGKSPDWTPLPTSVVDAVRTMLHDQLAGIAPRFSKDNPLWLSKNKLTTIHGCEAHHVATRDSFAWTPITARGTVLHKAVELGVHWRGDSSPAEIVDEAIARLADSNNNVADFLIGMSPGDAAQLRGYAVDLYTRFEECFPKLKPSWRPVTESIRALRTVRWRNRARHAGRPHPWHAEQKVIIDVKSGGLHVSHREDLRFYALVEALRSGMAPRRLATYSLAAARADLKMYPKACYRLQYVAWSLVCNGWSQSSWTRPNQRVVLRHCRWCPLNEECTQGMAYLARDPEEEVGRGFGPALSLLSATSARVARRGPHRIAPLQ